MESDYKKTRGQATTQRKRMEARRNAAEDSRKPVLNAERANIKKYQTGGNKIMMTIKFYENNNNFVVLNQYGENGETVYVVQLETHVNRTATTSDRKKALATFRAFKALADKAAAENATARRASR